MHPFYVDNQHVTFKHERNDAFLTFLTDWTRAQDSMRLRTNECAVYFPPSLHLKYCPDIEAKLVRHLRAWPLFKWLSPPLAQLGIDMARSASIECDISYEQRTLLHRHLAWIFFQDQVTEKLPLLGLHDTVGRIYIDNMKSILRDGPVADLAQFDGLVPPELLQTAIRAQRILAEDLMPLKKSILEPHHLQAVIDTLDLYFDNQWEEGKIFTTRPTLRTILNTRGFTIGIHAPGLLAMTAAEAQLYRTNDPCLMQVAVFVALFNDIAGLYKDIDSLKNKDDGSVTLNLVLATMREKRLSEKEAVQSIICDLNYFCRNFEFFIDAYESSSRQFYCNVLRLCFNMYDYHLIGADDQTNHRYGWGTGT
ncbi:hypothetical protein NHJ13734_008606 [Beauveria thailandica]